MGLKIRVNGIVEESIVDGPGLRYVVFTQGCPHRCAGCHNPETHDPSSGYELDVDEIIVALAENPLLSGVTFSGGEPFMQPGPLCAIARAAWRLDKNVVTYTGYTFEALLELAEENPHSGELLRLSDILVDGPYMEALRDLTLRFRGSRNQRVLDRDDRAEIVARFAVKDCCS